MAERSCYVILGVSPDESAAGIRSAYRALARKHHPDVRGEQGTSTFQEISEAYRVLGEAKQVAPPLYGDGSFKSNSRGPRRRRRTETGTRDGSGLLALHADGTLEGGDCVTASVGESVPEQGAGPTRGRR